MTQYLGRCFRIGVATLLEITGAALSGWGAALHHARPMGVGLLLFALAIGIIWSMPDTDSSPVSSWLRAMRYLPKRFKPWALGKAMAANRVERVDSEDSR